MPKTRQEILVEESESELEKMLHATTPTQDATAALAQLLSALDARRRRHESLAIEESAQALQHRS